MIRRDAGMSLPSNESSEMPEPFLPGVGERVPRPARKGLQPAPLVGLSCAFLLAWRCFSTH